MIRVKFYETAEDALLKFAVIIARHDGKWIFCKHRERDTYEIPGGHREAGEEICKYIVNCFFIIRRKGGVTVLATCCVAYEVLRYAARDVCKFCLAMLQMHATQNPQILARFTRLLARQRQPQTAAPPLRLNIIR